MPLNTNNKLINAFIKRTDLILAVAVVAILVFMIIPIPSFFLDILLALNITCSLMILLVPLNASKPLEFSVFPGVLLIITLFRLSLNVASTRLILGEAYAGNIIEAFGSFVVKGNYVVGLVIFIILVIINFVVITKGSGRIAEVAARFTLDAMPGKQMAIDADLNAGLIDDQEALERRKEIRQEADFYGAMDGASKFVRGDAVASILITAINIIGGLIIGVVQLNMEVVEAIETYTVLTVGDGLVSQLPALIISTAAGIIVAQANTADSLAQSMTTQFLAKRKPSYIAAGVLFVLGLVPGMPALPFFFLGLVMVGFGTISKTIVSEVVDEVMEEEPPPQISEQEQIENYLHVDPLEIEIGYSLIPLIDTNQSGELLHTLSMIRKQIAQEIGIIIPSIRIRDNVQLKSNEYVIKIRGNEVSRGESMIGYYLALVPEDDETEMEGIKTVDPTFNLPAYWLNEEQKEKAQMKGYSIVDAAAVISTNLMEVLKSNAHKILDRQAVQYLIDKLKEEHETVVEELVPNLVTIGTIQNVLKNLLQNSIPIKDLSTILESMADYAHLTKDPELLTEYVRVRLSESITNLYKNEEGAIYVMTLDPKLEEFVINQIQSGQKPSQYLGLAPIKVNELLTEAVSKMQELIATSGKAILITSPTIRRYIQIFFESALPDLVILSYTELLPNIDIHSIGSLGLSNYD